MAVTVFTADNNAVIKAADRAVIYGAEEQEGVPFGKVEKVSAFSGSAFWGGIGVVSLLAALCCGDIIGTVVSLVGILCTL
ncbi:hypothetical protein [Bartonella tribocorum]|uniref:hypothetical protein n=1 Tax=Bartonella tribocorum TaxID=85701 RepID=UPI0026AAD03B